MNRFVYCFPEFSLCILMCILNTASIYVILCSVPLAGLQLNPILWSLGLSHNGVTHYLTFLEFWLYLRGQIACQQAWLNNSTIIYTVMWSWRSSWWVQKLKVDLFRCYFWSHFFQAFTVPATLHPFSAAAVARRSPSHLPTDPRVGGLASKCRKQLPSF